MCNAVLRFIPFVTEIEGFFYTVVSLFHVVAPDDAKSYMNVFLDRLVSSANKDNASSILRL